MKIAFFISDHGFGHIMRNVAVIDAISRLGHEVVLITGDRQMTMARQYLQRPIQEIIRNTDAGLEVIPGTLSIDTKATVRAVRRHLLRWPELMELAKELHADRFVADIVPWALLAAKETGTPCFLMASFTWPDQYEWFLPEELLAHYQRAFDAADSVLMYDLANPPTKKRYPVHTDIGFTARPFHEDEAARIRARHRRKIVFLSLGGSNIGLDFEIDVSGLPYDFISAGVLHLAGANAETLDPSVDNTQDYVKAADFCIAKAGWTTVAEIMLAGVPAAFLERPDTPEDTMTITELKRRKAAISISTEDLKNMSKVMERLEQHSGVEQRYQNNYMKIAMEITGQTAMSSTVSPPAPHTRYRYNPDPPTGQAQTPEAHPSVPDHKRR